MFNHLHTEITIDAPAEQVWRVLTDVDAYPDWNPFIPRITGALTPGSRIEVQLQPPGGRGMTMRPSIRDVDTNRELRWLGHLGIPGLFDGEHRFVIEPLGEERVRFVQEERFSGLLAPLVLRFVGEQTRQGFERMNQALKFRAEGMA